MNQTQDEKDAAVMAAHEEEVDAIQQLMENFGVFPPNSRIEALERQLNSLETITVTMLQVALDALTERVATLEGAMHAAIETLEAAGKAFHETKERVARLEQEQ